MEELHKDYLLKIFEKVFQRHIICIILTNNEGYKLICKSVRAQVLCATALKNKGCDTTLIFGPIHLEKLLAYSNLT